MQQKNRPSSGSQATSREIQLKAQAKQQQLEKNANEKLAQLAQQQQQNREKHPAANPQQAAIQQKKDEKQLTKLAVKNYREVFLPGQMTTISQAQQLSPEAQWQLGSLTQNLTDKAWWKKQEGAQLASSIKAYGDTLTSLTTSLLGFDLASPPAKPASFSVSSLKAALATDKFDQPATTQLLQDAALSVKLIASEQLIKAVKEFSLVSSTSSSQEASSSPKKLKADIQESVRSVNKAMDRYYALIGSSTTVDDAQKALLKSTAAYLGKNDK
jgi:hypothetical protein